MYNTCGIELDSHNSDDGHCFLTSFLNKKQKKTLKPVRARRKRSDEAKNELNEVPPLFFSVKTQ